MMNYRNVFLAILIVMILPACAGLRLNTPALPTPRTIETVSPEEYNPTVAATATLELPSPTLTLENTPAAALPKVTITAIKGNLNIRRGPDIAYNPIAVLYKGSTAQVIAHDVLTKWAQIAIPNSDKTGWVSLLTEYSKVEGNLDALPGFTFTEWPVIAYLRNCTHHQMYILPVEITVPSSYGAPENEIWLNPGHYTALDLDLPDAPEVMSFDIREGQVIEILEDGTGEHRKCPE
jgi:hypothetical protein